MKRESFETGPKLRMSIGTKLIFLLTLSVGAVMLLTSFLFLRQREAALEETLIGELRAHAVSLQIALEENYAGGRISESQKLIDRLRDNSRIYAVLLFDDRGELLTISQPAADPVFQRLPELAEVIRTGVPVRSVRYVGGEKFLSVIKPVRLPGDKRGALELVKSLNIIEDDIFNARLNWLAITLFLLAIILFVVTVVLRRNLSRPLESLLKGAEMIGGGNLTYRVDIKSSGNELNLLGAKFNRMAENLAEQKLGFEREAESRLQLARELRHSERLASVGRLASGVAHELGAPLNVIDARAAQLLENYDPKTEKTRRNLEIIRRQTERISYLIRQLLNLSRPFNLNLRSVSLNDHLKETIEQSTADSERIKIEFSAEEDFRVRADPDFLRQVWINILQNARQAIENKDIENKDGSGEIKIEVKTASRDAGRFAAVRFTDTGGGIADEHLEKIFDPFYTTKDIGQGTGLGLAVAHRIVEEHGGTITAENNAETGGAAFTVYLRIAGDKKR